VSVAREVTLAQLEEAVRWQADMERADLRHTGASIRREINQSIRRYRDIVSDAGHSYFLQSHSGRLTPGPAVDPSDGETAVAWGKLELGVLDPPVVRIYGVDVRHGSYVTELTGAEWKQRNYYQERYGQTGEPAAFFVYDATTLGILPAPSADYAYTVWYLPDIRELEQDGDVFEPGLVGGDRWVVLDVSYKLALRDNYPGVAANIERERMVVQSELMSRAGKISMVGTLRRLDTRGRNRLKSWRSRWGW
jgi:hypothetical protein